MEALSTNRKNFHLTDDDGELLGEITYTDFLFMKADITLANTTYKVGPADFFGTRISVKTNDIEVASVAMNWHGHIVIAFKSAEELILKATGIFRHKYVLENRSGEKLMQLDPRINWNMLDWNYSISYDEKPKNILLVLVTIYAANYIITTMSGASSGMG
ncbi:hypothetical protein EIM50_18260 [Pseudoxanthomonas sp. SGD-10]|nr:hypothetical protein EIM50_18260 [Pseudoxanthomonas sp. SGD-10]